MEKQSIAPKRRSLRLVAIRSFVLIAAVCIAIDTFPSSLCDLGLVKKQLNFGLGCLGLSQGDWPLFAPNPVLMNGIVAAEVADEQDHRATWKSPDWSQASVWDKFVRFRHLNYFQRVYNNRFACIDLAAYLQRSIPNVEEAEPNRRWSETFQLLPAEAIVPPIVEVKLYRFQQRMMLGPDDPYPTQSETKWSNAITILLKQVYRP